MLTDSHCHLDQLDLSTYEGNLDRALENAAAHEVTRFLCVCIDLPHFPDVLRIAERYPNIHATVGEHPNEPLTDIVSIDTLIKLGSHEKVVGIGETGLDYFRTEGEHNIALQQQRFRTHIQAAKKLNKPLIIHTRQAAADTLRIMKEEGADQVKGVMHCFTESWEVAQAAMALGFYISFSGIITFKNAVDLQEVVQKMPWDRLLIETDAPYLAPVPYRGKTNEPAYVRYVAMQVAALKNSSLQAVAEYTTQNYLSLFKIS